MNNFIIPGTDGMDPDCGDEYWDDIEDECPDEEEFEWEPEWEMEPDPYFYYC